MRIDHEPGAVAELLEDDDDQDDARSGRPPKALTAARQRQPGSRVREPVPDHARSGSA